MSGLPAMVNGDGIKKRVQIRFGGYDHNPGGDDGSLWDMKNISGAHYPVLGTRKPRSLIRTIQRPGGLCAHDGLYWVEQDSFYGDGVKKGTVTPGEKTFVSLGRYLLIFPDKAYYHTEKDEFGSLEAKWQGTATVGNGTFGGAAAQGNTITTSGEAFPFEVNEAVTISGCTVEENNKTAVIQEISEDKRQLRFLENVFSSKSWSGSLTIERQVPDMDFVCANENRVWGCKGDTIYASYLGNPFIWNNFSGTATDSYGVEVGSAGDFTACCSYLGYPIFFKEDHIYKVYGSKPSNFQVMSSASLGVEQGSAKSLAVAGEKLFYLSRTGVMRYGGGIPENISRPFGNERYQNGVGGSDGENYYISMEDGSGVNQLMVYSTATGLWHKEDNSRVMSFAWDGELYFLTSEGKLWLGGNPRSIPEGATPEELSSFCEFGDFTENSPDMRGISRLRLRLELEENSRISVMLQYDGDGIWNTASTIQAQKKKSFTLPLIPRRCDFWRLRLEGEGQWRLHSLSREFYQGSDLE